MIGGGRAYEAQETETAARDTKVAGRRVAACLLDSCLVLFASCPALAPLLFLRTSLSAILSVLLLFLFVNLVVYLGYFVVFEGLSGRTLGKMLLGIEVVRAEDGRPPGPGRAALRALMFLAVDGLAGLFVILASSRHQRLGDMAANTLVVRRNRRIR
ncbi:MAG TPA: RDD family protein [Rubrobacter sp.]|nr:RDD family protein [Rubrobacter sp.]